MKGLLSTRLAVGLGVPVTLLYIAVIWLASQRSAEKVLEQTETIAREKARRYAAEINSRLAEVARIPAMHARVFESGAFSTEAQVDAYLVHVVETNKDIYGSCLAFEAHAFGPNRPYYAPYAYWKKSDGKVEFSQIGNPEYNHFKWPWYQLPRAAGRTIWTEPYFDEGGGNILMTTCSVPFYRDGKFWGVATIDMSLDELSKETARFKLGAGGYAFIVSKTGHFIAHPEAAKIMHGTIELENPGLAKVMMTGGSGFMRTVEPMRKDEAWIAYEPIPSAGFSLGLVYPQAEVLGEAFALRKELIALGALGVVALFFAILLISRSISRPVAALASAAKEVAAGNFDHKIDAVGATDEVKNLANAFTKMTRDLQMRMQELRYTTTLKERMEGELAAARSIQMALLSKQFPEDREFEIHAVVKPAREVGGDFYDFYRLDEERYVILIADVSGKGIPAALFMAVTKTLLKASSQSGLSAGEIVGKVNNELCNEADTGMFVTLLYALLNTATGDLEFCNAGHLTPFLLRENGDIAPLDGPGSAALGLIRDLEYSSTRVRLTPGDTLFMFTDGVTEAVDGQRVFYSAQRLRLALRDMHDQPIARMTRGVVRDVRSFSGEREQADDITVMAVRWRGDRLTAPNREDLTTTTTALPPLT